MPTSANHDIPTPTTSDSATIPTDLKAMADKIDSELDSIAPGQIIGVGAGEVLIANSSGVLTPRTIDGDATINEAGTLTIGERAIDTPQLGTSAVIGDRFASGAVTGVKVADRAISLAKTKMRAGTVTIPVVHNVDYGSANFYHDLGHTNYFVLASVECPALVTFEVSWGKGKSFDIHGDYEPENVASVNVRNLTGEDRTSLKVSVLVIDLT